LTQRRRDAERKRVFDSNLIEQHPEWYHQDENGRPYTTVPEWWDVIDLVYDDKSLWDYQIETLKQWVQLGVDGFRCDVASIVPLEFWQEARAAVAEVKPNVLWLAESVHSRFIFDRRRNGLSGHSDNPITARDGEMAVPETVVILRYSGRLSTTPFYGPLL
jgi:glycosidase